MSATYPASRTCTLSGMERNVVRSWNWRIVEFTVQDSHYVQTKFDADDPFIRRAGQCCTKGCGLRAECYLRYEYAVGLRGVLHTNQQQYCRRHAEDRFARQAKVTAP